MECFRVRVSHWTDLQHTPPPLLQFKKLVDGGMWNRLGSPSASGGKCLYPFKCSRSEPWYSKRFQAWNVPPIPQAPSSCCFFLLFFYPSSGTLEPALLFQLSRQAYRPSIVSLVFFYMVSHKQNIKAVMLSKCYPSWPFQYSSNTSGSF